MLATSPDGREISLLLIKLLRLFFYEVGERTESALTHAVQVGHQSFVMRPHL